MTNWLKPGVAGGGNVPLARSRSSVDALIGNTRRTSRMRSSGSLASLRATTVSGIAAVAARRALETQQVRLPPAQHLPQPRLDLDLLVVLGLRAGEAVRQQPAALLAGVAPLAELASTLRRRSPSRSVRPSRRNSGFVK